MATMILAFPFFWMASRMNLAPSLAAAAPASCYVFVMWVVILAFMVVLSVSERESRNGG